MTALVALGAACGRTAPIVCGSTEDCPKGSTCSNYGHCEAPQANCASDRECGFSLRCFEFQCVDKRTCTSDLECLAGTRCVRSDPVAATGVCAAPLTCVPGCPQGERCAADFRCIPLDACGSDLDCKTEEHCIFGECKMTACTDSAQCDPDRDCTPAGTCVAQRECVWDQQCPRDLSCQDGLCKVAAACESCQDGELCLNGRCVPLTPDEYFLEDWTESQ